MRRSMEYKAEQSYEKESWHSGGHHEYGSKPSKNHMMYDEHENKFYGSNMNKFGFGGSNAHMGFASGGKVKPFGMKDEHVSHEDKYMMNSVTSKMQKVHVPEKTMKKQEVSYSSTTGMMNGGHGFSDKHNFGAGRMSGGHGFGNKHNFAAGHGFGDKHNFGAGHGLDDKHSFSAVHGFGDKHNFGAGMMNGGHGFSDKHNHTTSMMNSGHGYGEKHKFHVPEKTMKMHESYEYSSYHSEEAYDAHHNNGHSGAWMPKCIF